MFRISAPWPCLLLIGCATQLPDAAAVGIEQEIVAVERARLAAFRNNDRAAFASLVANELVMTHSNGSVLDKAGEMAVMRPSTPERPLPTLELEDTQVRAHGDAAVLTGSLVERASGRLLVRLRFTNVYIRRGGRWLLLAGQLTRAAAG